MLTYKIGLSSWSKPLTAELFSEYQKAGVYAMEISMGIEQYDALDYAMTAKLAKDHDVKLWSVHLPCGPFDRIDISNRELAKYSVSYLGEVLKKCADIGVDKFIIHPSGEPIKVGREERMAQSKESLAAIAEIAAANGAIIAVEDLPRTCLGKDSAEIAELLTAHPALRVCFDTNHLLAEDPVAFIRNLGDKIVTTHISDYDFINERHWLPGEGKMDWQAILNAFQEVGYQGVWLYEVSTVCPNTIFRDRDLTCEDFMKNAKELFEGKTPTIISRPREDLGFWP